MTAQEVLDTSVAQLETLAAFLHEQLGEGSDGPGRVTTETRACNEILRSLRALILEVRTREGLAGWNPSRGWPVPYMDITRSSSLPRAGLSASHFCEVATGSAQGEHQESQHDS
jgi:hypothetical protein